MSDSCLQNWGKFLGVRSRISKVLSEKGGEPPSGPVEGYGYGLLGYLLLVPWGIPGGEGQLATSQPGMTSESLPLPHPQAFKRADTGLD